MEALVESLYAQTVAGQRYGVAVCICMSFLLMDVLVVRVCM